METLKITIIIIESIILGILLFFGIPGLIIMYLQEKKYSDQLLIVIHRIFVKKENINNIKKDMIPKLSKKIFNLKKKI